MAERWPDPHKPAMTATSPAGAAYRGKAGCQDVRCSRDGHPGRCYGWHCLFCDGPSNAQGNCGRCEAAAQGGETRG